MSGVPTETSGFASGGVTPYTSGYLGRGGTPGEEGQQRPDPVNHPAHYTQHPSGVECIDVVEHMNFNLGNAVKYIWRSDMKGDPLENLRKAEFYIQREIERRTRQPSSPKLARDCTVRM